MFWHVVCYRETLATDLVFGSSYHFIVIQEWMEILGVDEFNFQRFMASETQMLTWKSEGLPTDDLSVQNAIAIKNSTVSPLIVDPSSQVR